jgi:hypothetical protein
MVGRPAVSIPCVRLGGSRPARALAWEPWRVQRGAMSTKSRANTLSMRSGVSGFCPT